MNKTRTGLDAAHPAVQGYAVRHGLSSEGFRNDGRLDLTVDAGYRLQLRTAPLGRIAIVSMLLDLSALSAARTEELLTRLCTWATGMVREHPAALALDDSGQLLLLQQQLPSSADVDQLERGVAEFVNSLAFWTRTSAKESGRP